MYQYSNYQVLNIPFPEKGMNRNISVEQLPKNRTHILENFIPVPLGEGSVRFGFTPVLTLHRRFEFYKVFSYTTPQGQPQLLLYLNRWVTLPEDHYDKVASQLDRTEATFAFTDETYQSRFIRGAKIRLEYNKQGIHSVEAVIASYVETEDAITVTFENQVLPDEVTLRSVQFQIGQIFVFDLNSRQLVSEEPLATDLSACCLPRAIHYQGKLILCNGVDNLLVWDGRHLNVLYDFVAEQNADPQRTNDTQLTLQQCLNPDKFAVGNTFKLKIDEQWHGPYTITAFNNNVITSAEVLPDFCTVNIVYYRDTPPPFSYLFVFNHRIWALGEGAVSLAYRANPMRVYYTDRTEKFDGWFNEITRQVPYLDIGYKHQKVDNLEAIRAMNDKLIFIGRNQTQVWNGARSVEPENYTWEATVNGGVIHGNLIVNLPNDLKFISQNGVQLFSTLNVAKQFSIASVNAVDPVVRDYIQTIKNSDYNYRNCDAFEYKDGPFVGFKIGNNPVLTGLVDTSVKSWTLLTGLFRECTAINSDFHLFLGKRNKLLCYSDGSYVPKHYSDDGAAISFTWSLPVIKSQGKPFKNKRFEIKFDYPSSFVLKETNTLSVLISGDLPENFIQSVDYQPEIKGDILGTLPLAAHLEDDSPDAHRFGVKHTTIKTRFRFIAQHFWCTLYGKTVNGPIRISRLTFFGERNR